MWPHAFLCLKHAIYILKEKNKLDNLIPRWIYSLCSNFCTLLLCLVILVLHFCERILPISWNVWMWELDHTKGWAPKNWCFWIVVLQKTLESLLDCKEIKPKQINPENSLEGLMLKLRPQYFGPLRWRADSLEKDPDAGKSWRQMEKGAVQDEMIRQHHQFNEHEFELAWCGPWGHKSGTQLKRLNKNTLSGPFSWLCLLGVTFKGVTLFLYIEIKSCIMESNICLVGGLQEHCNQTYVFNCQNRDYHISTRIWRTPRSLQQAVTSYLPLV